MLNIYIINCILILKDKISMTVDKNTERKDGFQLTTRYHLFGYREGEVLHVSHEEILNSKVGDSWELHKEITRIGWLIKSHRAEIIFRGKFFIVLAFFIEFLDDHGILKEEKHPLKYLL